jgi:hypothetical protein
MSQTIKDKFVALHAHSQKLQLSVQSLLHELVIQIGTQSLPDMCDVGYFCREVSKIMHDLKVSLDGKQGVVSRVLAGRVAGAALQGEVIELRGEFCVATPDVRNKPTLPKEGTEEYRLLMRWIGVPEETINSPLLRPSFTGLEEELTKRMALGEPLPPGIVGSFTDVSVVYRKSSKKRKDKDGQEE